MYRDPRRLCSLVLGTVLAAGLANGQDTSADEAQPKEAFVSRTTIPTILKGSDRNGDGMLQRDEAPIQMLPSFDEIDRDHDNQIDSFEAWEYDARRRRAVESSSRAASRRMPSRQKTRTIRTLLELVELADANGDEKLSQDEMPASLRERFLEFDLDADGFFDREEARRLEHQRPNETDKPRQRTIVREVRLMDTNGDGLLGKREASLRIQRIFEKLDRDGDGAIDLDEARAADAGAR